mgnify:FL=1
MKPLVVVGLGNPGTGYLKTRHNVGERYLRLFAKKHNLTFKKNIKLNSYISKYKTEKLDFNLVIPLCYMNESGSCLSKIKNYFRIEPSQLIIIHDDLDLPIGKIKFKDSGGHGGHNGLRDIIKKLNKDNSFKRLRIGIGRPGKGEEIIDYVLSKPKVDENKAIEKSIKNSFQSLEKALEGNWEYALKELHTNES